MRLITGFCLVLFPLTFVVCAERGESQSSEQDPRPESTAATDTLPFDIDYICGRFVPAQHPGFVQIDSIHADRPGMYLRKDAYTAFISMYEAAKADGIQLQIRSATRNFDYQKGIWERKWTGETKLENNIDASVAYPDSTERALAILRYSSMPGTSRHHWGTDIDLNAFTNAWFESGEGLKIYTWLSINASRFGFCQPYTPKGPDRPTGYEEEKWHWSYTPISSRLTSFARQELKNDKITGFHGSSVAAKIDVVGNYVLGINELCVE